MCVNVILMLPTLFATTRSLSGSALPIHPVIAPALKVIERVHSVWSLTRQGTIYGDPTHFVSLIGGRTLQTVAGENRVIRFSAIVLMFLSRVLKIIEQDQAVARAHWKLKSALKGRYILEKNRTIRIATIAKRIFLFIKESFALVMRACDILEVFYLSSEKKHLAVGESLYHLESIVDRFTEESPVLLEGIKKNQAILETLFANLQLNLSAEELIKELERTLKGMTSFHLKMKNITTSIGAVAQETVQMTGFQICTKLNLPHLFPQKYLPPTKPSWESKAYESEQNRFIPLELIQVREKEIKLKNLD